MAVAVQRSLGRQASARWQAPRGTPRAASAAWSAGRGAEVAVRLLPAAMEGERRTMRARATAEEASAPASEAEKEGWEKRQVGQGCVCCQKLMALPVPGC